ncbi:MAG: hypothetical protein ACXVGN_00140 [Mycobacteriaceae bacterium]
MTDHGQGCDVAIGGLEFKLAVSKDNPYERATAQFRKDQFDSAPTVGDQSLTGWWTRGQLSFHRGSGIKYYEVLDGETVLNRFQASSGIDPWTPGELTLSGALTTVALTNISDCVGATVSGAPGVHALTSDGKLHFADTVASAPLQNTKTLSDYTGITGIATSGTRTYLCTPSAIQSPKGASVTYTNFGSDPSFVTSGDGWGGVGYPNWPATLGAGTLSYSSASPAFPKYASRTYSGLTVGTTYTFRLFASRLDRTIQIGLDGDPVSSSPSAPTVYTSPSTSLTQSLTFTATSTVHAIYVAATSWTSSAETYIFTSMGLTDDPYETAPANPDDTPARWTWSGTAHASNPKRVVAANSYYDTLWSPVPGRTWIGAWWAKGRLFALDSAGKFHTLSTVGGTADDATTLFWNPALGTTGWSVAESPGAVYISHGTDIYKVTPDASGAIPVITTPVVSASLPTGETISTIYAYLGRMVICTNQGLRVAIIDASTGDLVYGPRLVDGDFSGCVRVTALGDLAYVTGTPTGAANPSIYAVNMADNADLQPAWAEVRPVSTGALYGATATPDGKIMSWDGAGFFRTTSGYVTTGYVETGFHRLGTLEPKSFQYLRVKTQGTSGNVVVEAILPDGATSTVGTVAAGSGADLSLATAVPTPQEYIALKFTLNGDGTHTPTLLGYQLKALPAPARQRMIRLPLELKDVERRGGAPASGYTGSAWDRLKALEDMESAGATFAYTDYRTNETGKVFVETVEHRGVTPPGPNSTGFGGIIWVTLRKLD